MDKEEAAFATAKASSTRFFKLTSLVVGFIALCLMFIIAFVGFKPDQYSLSDRYFPSPTATNLRPPTLTPTATITPTITATLGPTPTSTPNYFLTAISQGEGNIAFEDNFETNDNNWEGFFSNSTVTIEDGRLSLASDSQAYIGMSYCTSCPPVGDTYYLEAEVSSETDSATANYGLAFCLDKNYTDYYVFQVNPTSKLFDLYKHHDTWWDTLAHDTYAPTEESIPAADKLGVYFDHGIINLYVNNSLVYSYVDEQPISCKRYGFFKNSGEKIFADNLIIYDAQIAP